jgi:hypothetical protein
MTTSTTARSRTRLFQLHLLAPHLLPPRLLLQKSILILILVSLSPLLILRTQSRCTVLQTERQTLLLAIWTLVAWLHVRCGLGRERATKVLKLVIWIVLAAISFGRAFAHAPITIARDVRSALTALCIEPKLHRSVCCPKCFAPYSLNALPDTCPRKETRRSWPCGESLWMTRQTRHGSKRVPRRLYTTQSVISWLEYFVALPGIEDLLDASYQVRTADGYWRDIWDTPAWSSLGGFTRTYGNLTFSYYIDWFNPLTNKIAGKKVSCGAIMMFCLNLPPHLRHLPEYTFFVGLTPPPHEPNIVTITAVQDPVVDQLEPLYHQGHVFRSARHPNGFLRRVAVLPFIGDLMALQKACGFAHHGHKHFCFYCLLPRSEIERLDFTAWPMRHGSDVVEAGTEWRQASTKTARKEIFDRTGNRWSSLMRLTYRDHVLHIVLGVMHNWLEGILQHHVRRRWNLGVDVFAEATDEPAADPPSEHLPSMDIDDILTDSQTSELASEVSDIISDSQSHPDLPSHSRHLRRFHTTSSLANLTDLDMAGPDDSPDDADTDFTMADNESSNDSDSDDDDEASTPEQCIFTPADLARIRECMGDVVLPTWMTRPPRNLGSKSHGKLKADEWFVLFTVFFPMCLLEIWPSQSQRHRLLVQNFMDLVDCTDIVCSFSVKSNGEDADLYEQEYVRYRRSSQFLFPNRPSVPNHHYGMHNGDLMRFWGPLMPVSEFAYEQHNGTFQKIKTNGHLCKPYGALLIEQTVDDF